MIEKRVKFIAWFVIFVAICINSAGLTDADLSDEAVVRANKISASTLSISVQNTVNNSHISSFFNSFGFQPGGFDVKALRIKNSGKIKPEYYLKVENTTGDISLCQTFDLQLVENLVKKYDGKLVELNFDSQNPLDNQPKDLVLFLLFAGSSDSLKNKSCSFRLAVQTKQTIGLNQKGFFDRRYLDNVATTGSWQ